MARKLLQLTFVILFLFALICGCRKESKDTVSSLDDLNRAVDAVAMRNGGQFPPDTNEVAKFMALWGKSMPVPPVGKVLDSDPQTKHYLWKVSP